MAVELQRHLFTVADFHRMLEAGIFREDDRVELINGEILQMTPIGSRHSARVDSCPCALALQGGAVLS